jgi:hypothetical protein
MGWYEIRATITGHRSAHNSINDELDKVRMEWFLAEVRRLAERESYKPLNLTITDFDE